MRYYGSFSNGTENVAGELPHIKQFKNKHFSAKCVGLSRAGACLHSSLNSCVCRCSEDGVWKNGWKNKCSVPVVLGSLPSIFLVLIFTTKGLRITADIPYLSVSHPPFLGN